MTSLAIRNLSLSELKTILSWANAEGWNPGLSDAESFYQADNTGFFGGYWDNELVVSGCAINYNDAFSFCGLYIVKPKFRGKGFGLQLTEKRLEYCGNRSVGIDGVMENVSKYQRIGYKPYYKQIRYEYTPQQDTESTINANTNIVTLNKLPFQTVSAFDNQFFPANREAFLKHWLVTPDSYALGYRDNAQQLQGYGVIRPCQHGFKIGPLFANSLQAARCLFDALCQKSKNFNVYIDVPEPNSQAQFLVNKYQMKKVFEVMRMYRNGAPDVDISGVYGVTSYEIG